VIDGLVTADRLPRPGLLDYKKVVEPVRLSVEDDWTSLSVTNLYDFVDLAHLVFDWVVMDASGAVATGSLGAIEAGPRETTTVSLPAELTNARAESRILTISARLATNTGWADAGHEIAWGQAGAVVAQLPTLDAIAPDVRDETISLGQAVFARATGRLTRLKGLEVDGPSLNLWRAPTDNDNGHDRNRQEIPTDAQVWESTGLSRLESRTVSVTAGDGELVVHDRYGMAVFDHVVDVRYTWRSDGTSLALAVAVEPGPNWTGTWARIGFDLTLPDSLQSVRWTGLGPGPKYPDTGQAQRRGWFEHSVSELQVNYARPQENGSRAGVTELSLVDAGSGTGLTIRGEGFSFAVRPWTQAALAEASHPFDLAADGALHLTLDAHQHGIGTASCGPGVMPAYRLEPQSAAFAIVFE
jgi:beta-galactosidase